jgi:1-acyl-sn-glycerol-3-phosphate acyltransferase
MELSLQTSSFSQVIARTILRLLSWKLDVIYPESPKFVLVGAPHTSGWDLLFALLLMHGAGIKMYWVGKDTIFRWPLGILMRWLGGIPVNRRSRNNFVQQVVDIFDQSDELVIAIAPEGTRSNAKYWKTGFYYIALGAGVPIALGFIDYGGKAVGVGPTVIPSGDIEADFVRIKEFYTGIEGKNPELQGEIKTRSD